MTFFDLRAVKSFNGSKPSLLLAREQLLRRYGQAIFDIITDNNASAIWQPTMNSIDTIPHSVESINSHLRVFLDKCRLVHKSHPERFMRLQVVFYQICSCFPDSWGYFLSQLNYARYDDFLGYLERLRGIDKLIDDAETKKRVLFEIGEGQYPIADIVQFLLKEENEQKSIVKRFTKHLKLDESKETDIVDLLNMLSDEFIYVSLIPLIVQRLEELSVRDAGDETDYQHLIELGMRKFVLLRNIKYTDLLVRREHWGDDSMRLKDADLFASGIFGRLRKEAKSSGDQRIYSRQTLLDGSLLVMPSVVSAMQDRLYDVVHSK